MISVQAVYENGVLRPSAPLELSEGESVSMRISPIPPMSTVDAWERQLQSAKSIQEWLALANACPCPDSEFDILQAINESRRLTGFRLTEPELNSEALK